MNNETMMLLESHFDAAFAAFDGIKKLRELILTLAMQGKLVPQDPNDEPASELLKAIELEKQRLVKEKKIRYQKPLPNIRSEEVPYVIPNSWKWCYLDDLCTLITDGTHHTPTYTESGIPFVSVKNLSSGHLDFSDTRFISEQEHNELIKRCHPEKGNVLLTKVGTTGIAVTINTDREFSIFVSVALLKVVKEFIDIDYLARLINSPLVKKYSADGTEGVGNKNLVLRKIKAFIIPIPPLAEQRRIVAEIDRLMARCDELEKLRADRSQKLLTVHTAALDNLLKAKESSDFSSAWHFITQSFSELYSVKENVAELRKAILQLAVMGKLVPQDPNDEPASELLKAIELEKQRLVKEGKIKKSKPLPEITLEEIPYKLPKKWEWVRLGEISLFSDSGWSPQCLSEPRSGQEWGVLKVSA
jgi:type I restriction enzyme, S subunit